MSTLQLQQLGPILSGWQAKLQGDLDQIRQGFEVRMTQFPPAAGVTFEVENVDGIPAIWCVPSNAVKDRILLYLHGGGYVVGSARAYKPMASEIAVRLKARVLIPDYRLAPEHPYPAALEDAVKAYRWLIGKGTISMAGDSCGGGLTIASLVAARDAGLPMPVGAALLSPWADLGVSGDSATTKAGEDVLLSAEALKGMAGAIPLASRPAPARPGLMYGATSCRRGSMCGTHIRRCWTRAERRWMTPRRSWQHFIE